MDIYGRSTADGAAVVQWPSNGGTNQTWQFADAGALSTATGATVDQWTCNGGANQLWTRTVSGQVASAPSFTLSVTPGTVSLAAGASTTSTIMVTPANGFSGTVSLNSDGGKHGCCRHIDTNHDRHFRHFDDNHHFVSDRGRSSACDGEHGH